MTEWPEYPPMLPAVLDSPTDSLRRLVWRLLPAQVVLTGLVTYVVIAAWTVIGGTFTEGFQVIGFALFSAPLTILVFILGLPLRLSPRARSWWFGRTAWPLALFGIAVLVLCLSYVVSGAGPVHYGATIDWPATDGFAPNEWVFLPALGMLGFASMHMLLPRRGEHGRP